MIGGHGGNIYQLAETLGCPVADIVDMSSNVNPLGPMPELMNRLKDRLESIACLPQVDARSIRNAFAQRHGVDPRLVLAGNGSTQWIYTLPLALKARRSLILAPTYADYADACAMHGTSVQYLLSVSEHQFDFDLAKASRMASKADLVFICNPNNPTGRLLPAEALVDLCRSRPDTIFVIDESYLPFVPQSRSHSLIKHPLANAVVISSMSKIFRLPGLRIGFVKTSPEIARRLGAYTLPWTVNSLAAEAVLWLMQHPNEVDSFITESRRFIQGERDLFCREIAKIPEITAFDSCTSYILMQLPDPLNAERAWRAMAQEKLLIRDCSNFFGLTPRHIRVSLKDRKNNQKAAALLLNLCRK